MALSQRTTDKIFVVGFASGLFWCGSQAMRALTTTAGVSLAQYAAFCIGFMFQLALAITARRKSPGRVITQMLLLFGTWSVLSLALSALVAFGTNYHWSGVDTTIASLSAIGLTIIVGWTVFTKTPLNDASMKAWTNIVLKSIPQFILVEKVLTEGPAGITTVAIVTGSISILTRLVPMSDLLLKGEANREEKWLWVTDAVNLISWLSVTAVWLLK